MRQIQNRKLNRISEVDWAREILIIHHPHHALDHIVDITERASLSAVPVYRYVLAPKGLDDKVAYDPAVVLEHPRPVGIEYPYHPYVYPVLPVVVEHEGLGAPLALVVACPEPYGVRVAPVILGLWMNQWVAV